MKRVKPSGDRVVNMRKLKQSMTITKETFYLENISGAVWLLLTATRGHYCWGQAG